MGPGFESQPDHEKLLSRELFSCPYFLHSPEYSIVQKINKDNNSRF
jgi:hypothetical protein